jgi:hypothetical protein
MEPTNKEERQSAIKRFAGIYALSLLFPLIASFFMFSKPSGALKDENERLKIELEKQAKLIQTLDSLTAQSMDLQRLDKEIELLSRDSSRTLELSEKRKQSDVIESTLRSQVQQIRRDTIAMEQGGVNRRLASSFTNAFEALITYRYNIASFRSMLGPNAKCATELASLKRENDELKRDMQRMSQSAGSKNECLTYIYRASQLETEVKQRDADINAYKNSIGAYTSKIDELEEKLKNSSKPSAAPVVTNTGISEAELSESRAMAQIAEIDCLLKQADPRLIISDDKQRLKYAGSAYQKITEVERSSSNTIRTLGKQKKDEYNRIINDIKKGKG